MVDVPKARELLQELRSKLNSAPVPELDVLVMDEIDDRLMDALALLEEEKPK